MGMVVACVVALQLSACSLLHRTRYLAPVSETGHGVYDPGFARLSGPPTGWQIESDRLTVRIEMVEIPSKIVAFGPFVFPVVPTLLNWFSKSRWPNPLEMDLVFTSSGSVAKWDPFETTISFPDGRSIRPIAARDSDSGEMLNGESVISSNGARRYCLSYPVSRPERMTLSFGPFNREGRQTELPPIHFSPAKGWAVSGVP